MNRTTATEPRPAEPAPPEARHEDPHDCPTPEQRAKFEAYMAEPKELPKSCVDPATGRLLPMSEEERKARWEAGMKRLAEIDAMEGEEPDWLWEQIEREMNEERALEGRGPAFPERY